MWTDDHEPSFVRYDQLRHELAEAKLLTASWKGVTTFTEVLEEALPKETVWNVLLPETQHTLVNMIRRFNELVAFQKGQRSRGDKEQLYLNGLPRVEEMLDLVNRRQPYLTPVPKRLVVTAISSIKAFLIRLNYRHAGWWATSMLRCEIIANDAEWTRLPHKLQWTIFDWLRETPQAVVQIDGRNVPIEHVLPTVDDLLSMVEIHRRSSGPVRPPLGLLDPFDAQFRPSGQRGPPVLDGRSRSSSSAFSNRR
ncbi:hypothetical protein JCM10212_007138 [Sporobolomyces blumeae]